MYKTFKEVAEELKFDIKRYHRDRQQVIKYLHEMAADFSKNRREIGLQETELKQKKVAY